MSVKKFGNDDQFGFFEIKFGKRGIKLSGWKGLLVLAGGCLALKLAFTMAVGVLKQDNNMPQPDPQSAPMSAPASRSP
jgi:hypothetical protein